MHRRAFVAYSFHGEHGLMSGWMTSDIPWPPSHEDLESVCDRVRIAKSTGHVTITCLTWLGPVVDGD